MVQTKTNKQKEEQKKSQYLYFVDNTISSNLISGEIEFYRGKEIYEGQLVSLSKS